MSSEDTRKNNQSCVTCGKSIDSRDLASMQCGHPFHYQCLQVSLGDSIRRKDYPICCPVPQCFVEPSMYFMSVVLEEPDFQDYLLLEKNSVQAFETYDCPSCEQSFLAFRTNQTHKCLKCYNTICLECAQLAHPNKPCSQNTTVHKQKQQLAQQQVQPSQPLTVASLPSPPAPHTLVLPSSTSVAPQTQLQQSSSHSRKQSKVQLQSQESTNLYQFQHPQSFQFQQEQQHQYQQIHLQQQQYNQQTQKQHSKESSQTARKPSPRRNSTSTLADTGKNVPLRQLSLKKKETNHTSTGVDRKQTEEIRSSSNGKQASSTLPRKSQQHPQPPQQQQLLQRQYPSTVAPSPTAGQFTHKKNSLSSFQAQHGGNSYMASSKDSNFNPTMKNHQSCMPSSTSQMNKTAKTSRKSFDTPTIHASSEDINKILSQTAALLKMQPNLLLPASYNPC